MSLAFGGHIIAGLALNGSAVSACYNGQIVWPEEQMATVFLDPGRTSNYDYLKMRFVTPNGDEIILEDGLTATASASAMVPVNSTAYWTANGDQTNASARYHVSALGASGFSGMSAYTAVTTGFYDDPNVESYGSAVLTSTGSASARSMTVPAYKAAWGQGNDNWNTKVSASSWAGEIDPAYTTAGGQSMWIPSGAKVAYCASSITGRTYSFNENMTAMPEYGIKYVHSSVGTQGTASGLMTGARSFMLANGRNKYVYATGTAYPNSGTATASSTTWRSYTILTAFSSNLSNGSSNSTYINGSANAGLVNGFSLRKEYGQVKNSAGAWTVLSASNDMYVWKFITSFMTMSGTMSGQYSGIRAKGPTANNNTTYIIYGYQTASGSYSLASGTFAAPTASGKTSTHTHTASANLAVGAGSQVNVCNMFHCAVPQTTALLANCRGAWTASGRVI